MRLKQNKILQTPAKHALLPSALPAAPGWAEAWHWPQTDTHTPPEKGVSRSAVSKNRVFSGHGTERHQPGNAVAFISRAVTWPRSAQLLLLARWASPGLCSLRSAPSPCTCSQGCCSCRQGWARVTPFSGLGHGEEGHKPLQPRDGERPGRHSGLLDRGVF